MYVLSTYINIMQHTAYIVVIHTMPVTRLHVYLNLIAICYV